MHMSVQRSTQEWTTNERCFVVELFIKPVKPFKLNDLFLDGGQDGGGRLCLRSIPIGGV